MKSRVVSLLSLPVLAIALVSGCSSSDSTTESESGDAAPAAATDASGAVSDNKVIDDSIVFLQIETSGYVQYPTTDGGLEWSDEWTVTSGCTGWFAGSEGEIVTAGHCVDPEEARKRIIQEFLDYEGAIDLANDAISNWKVEGFDAGAPLDVVLTIKQPSIEGQVINDWMPVQLVDLIKSQDGDLALLRANGVNGDTPALRVASEQAESGDPVTAIGFPSSVSAVSNEMVIPNPSFKTGTVSSRQISERGVAGLEVNADISGGMSVGPTVNANGEVIGVNSFTISGEEQAFNFITDTRDLNRFLQQNGVGN
jgi:serine protease Do